MIHGSIVAYAHRGHWQTAVKTVTLLNCAGQLFTTMLYCAGWWICYCTIITAIPLSTYRWRSVKYFTTATIHTHTHLPSAIEMSSYFDFAADLLTPPPCFPEQNDCCCYKNGQTEKWALITYVMVWIVSFALPSILYVSHELVAILSKYNALFVRHHKAISMILTVCYEALRVTREEVAGLSCFNIVSTTFVKQGGTAVTSASPCWNSSFPERDGSLLHDSWHIYDGGTVCSFERSDSFILAPLFTPPWLVWYFTKVVLDMNHDRAAPTLST